jgi:murein DD-endopeptidase MepM/ murein hydrolase activator NlpD
MFRQAGSVDIRILTRLSTVCLLALGVSACSSDAVRFTETPFDSPFRTAQAPAPVRDPVTTGSIGNSPVQAVPSSPVVRSQALPPPQAVASAPIAAPAAPAPMAAPQQPVGGSAAGWTAQGGTPVVIAQGETIDMISSRYGVPRAALLSANGLSNGNVAPGTRITIPVYNASGSGAVAAAPAAPAPRSAPAAAPAARVASAPANEPRGFVRGPAPAERPAIADRAAQMRAAKEAKAAAEADPKKDLAADAQAMRESRARFAAEAKAKAEAKKAAAAAAPEAKPAKVVAAPVEKPAKPVAVASAPAVEPKPAAAAPVAAPKVEAAAPAEPKTTASLPKQEEAASTGDKADFRWPVRGRVITGFAGKGGNEGLNIAVPDGTPVKAAEAGTVAYAGSELKGYGNLVLIRHPNGYVSAYAHNGELKVKRGDAVKRGQVVASSGQTGNVSSPQLHFELRKGSTPVDPTPYLNN